MRIAFTVLGRPQPAGSKTATPGAKTGVRDSNPKAGPWMQQVAATAFASAPDGLLDGPIGMAVVFHLRRPVSHFNRHSELKPAAPAYPTVRPDSLKLARLVEDALSTVLYRDDAQIVDQAIEKRYGEPERTEIVIWTVQP